MSTNTFHLSVLGSNFNRPILEPYSNTQVNDNPKASEFFKQLENTTFVTYDQTFDDIIGPNPKLEVLATAQYPFAHEAGVYVMKSNEVFFTSNRLGDTTTDNQYTEINKINLSTREWSTVEPKKPILLANGGTYHDGRIIICSQGQGDIGGSIVSLDPISNEVTTIIDNFFGLKFNSPNDIVVSSDGCYWFTDPSYGYEQKFRNAPQLGEFVYCFDPSTGNIRVVADGFVKPNGIAFSPDEKILYITDTGFFNGMGEQDVMKPHTIYAFDVSGKILFNRRVFAVVDVGIPDGIKLDVNGNVYVGAGDGVHVFNNSGTLLGKIVMPQSHTVSNLVFVRNLLIMFTDNTIYAVNLMVKGALNNE
ncbi:1710_t:CDS:1 [Diversispora eburnea]|uniref:1710_t:CDS:1 n=1 Tax=Diversispora eburnea TaxID=1213867 RepID=A0A9N8YQT1_9GLOM|nr:1710_t:CDS:1 [Diversispora eburnea]